MGGCRFAVRVKPGARRGFVGGRWDGRLGVALVVAVTAPAVDGRANDAVLRALADALGIARRDIRIVSGATSRDKVIEVESTEAAARVETLIGVSDGDHGQLNT